MQPSAPLLVPPTVVPAVREPHWQVLALDLNWLGLWGSSESAVAKEIARLEARLHSPTVTDHLELIAVKSRLAAYQWLRETVEEQARRAHERETATLVAAVADAQPRRSRWRRGGDSVVPTLG